MNTASTTRRVQRIRHELRRREVRVARVEPTGPNFVAVTFCGESMADFVSDSFDDHVKFMFDGAGGEAVRRDYTPRHFDRDARELTIEFALHGHGPAAEWARRATPGQPALIGGPRGSMIIPIDHDWHLLAGDASALPAIRRRVEELPRGTRAIVVLQLAADEHAMLNSAADLDVRMVATSHDMLAAIEAMRWPAGDGFVWCAGEASVMASLRNLLIEHKHHPREAMRVAAYWKRGTAEFHENLEA